MTEEKNYFKEVNPYSNSYVTFGYGVKGEILGKGKLYYTGLPSLEDVLLVEVLISNLISINQLWDQDIYVNFNRSECIVTKKYLK